MIADDGHKFSQDWNALRHLCNNSIRYIFGYIYTHRNRYVHRNLGSQRMRLQPLTDPSYLHPSSELSLTKKTYSNRVRDVIFCCINFFDRYFHRYLSQKIFRLLPKLYINLLLHVSMPICELTLPLLLTLYLYTHARAHEHTYSLTSTLNGRGTLVYTSFSTSNGLGTRTSTGIWTGTSLCTSSSTGTSTDTCEEK